MAGGTWQAQNKVRPGAYLNFISTPTPTTTIGDRGIAIIPLPLSWGDTDKLIEVYSTDLLDGKSLSRVGFTAFDEASKLLGLVLSNCYKALVYRADTGGIKAKVTITSLLVTAKYPGTLGNKIQIAIVDVLEDGTIFDVKTYVDSIVRDTQRVEQIADLKANDFVTFSGTGDFTEVAGESLTGGTNGTVSDATMYPQFLSKASFAHWQTMAIPKQSSTIATQITNFIRDQRENQGRYVQAVLNDYPADYEGIINSTMGVVLNGVRIEPDEFVCWVAGASAGAPIVNTPQREASLTGKVINGATEIIGELDYSGIIESLNSGEFVLSTNQNGAIKVEQDINSFLTVVPNKSSAFRKNRIIRTLDEMGTTIKTLWENSYMGKVNNNTNGRALFRADIIGYMNELQNAGAIDNFAGASDVDVEKGTAIDAVVSEVRPQPVDSMEKLYMTINLQS